MFLEPAEVGGDEAETEPPSTPTPSVPTSPRCWRGRPSRDENRPEAVARRRKTNHRTARENIAALVDPGSFIEYGSLAVAAQAAAARATISSAIRPPTAS